jgi:hypothetical protein
MTGVMEHVVRPFQLKSWTYPVRVFDTGQTPAAPSVVVDVGREGATKLFNESFSESITTYGDIKSKETKRDTSKKHITNPNDDSQYVDVEVINKLSVEQGQGRTYQKINYEYNNN